MAHESRKAGPGVTQLHGLTVMYDGIAAGEYVVGRLVEPALPVELKAAKALDEAHHARCINAEGIPPEAWAAHSKARDRTRGQRLLNRFIRVFRAIAFLICVRPCQSSRKALALSRKVRSPPASHTDQADPRSHRLVRSASAECAATNALVPVAPWRGVSPAEPR